MNRKFWLENRKGVQYNLTNIYDSSFLDNPDGLGANAVLDAYRLGNSQKATNIQWDLLPITGEVIFLKDYDNAAIYKEYRTLFDFAADYPIYLHYQTPADSEVNFYREVVLTNIGKTQISYETNTLNCPVVLTPLTMWMDDKESVIEVDSTRESGKVYELKRPYFYSQAGYDNVLLINESDMTVPIIIEIYGECTDPSYYLYDSDNTLYGVGKFNGTFDYVRVDSNDLSEDIVLTTNGTNVTNPASYQDPTVRVDGALLTFIKLLPGRNTLKFLFNDTFSGKILMRWRGNYVTR